MFDTFYALWSDMHDEGLITDAEHKNASFSQYYRSVEEFCAPFNDSNSAVSKAGLKLVSHRTGLIKCPYNAAFEAANGTMSNRDFARSYVPTLRSWSETVFLNALDTKREAALRAELVDLFYQRYEDRVCENPDGHAMDYVHCYLAIEKVKLK